MAKKKKAAAKVTVHKGAKIGFAIPNDKAVNKVSALLKAALKKSGLSGPQLHEKTGISIAMARRLVRGDIRDLKLATLARLLECKEIGLTLS